MQQTFSMPYLAIVSVNSAYGYNPRTGQKFLKSEAKQWKMILTSQVRQWLDGFSPENIKITLSLLAKFPVNRGQKPDADNFCKLAQDAIAEGIGIDDWSFQWGSIAWDRSPENGQGTLEYTVHIADTFSPIGEMSAQEAREKTDLIKNSLETTRTTLLEIYERKGWLALGYESWREYGQIEFSKSISYLYRLKNFAEIERTLSSEDLPPPTNEAQIRPLVGLSPDEQTKAWELATIDGQPTGHQVENTVRVLQEAEADLLDELGTDYKDENPNRWRAIQYQRAVELLEQQKKEHSATKTSLLKTIEDEALYHYTGQETSKEMFASTGQGTHRQGIEDWWASVLIPYCISKQIEIDNLIINHPINLKEATPELRRVIEEYPLGDEEQTTILSNILSAVATMSRGDLSKLLNGVRQAKAEITIERNLDGSYTVQSFPLTQYQLDRFLKQNRFSTIITLKSL